MKKRVFLSLLLGVISTAGAQTFPSARGSWSRAANELSASRLDGQVTLLLDGRVAVSGGSSKVIDIFDPVTNTFTPGPADLRLRKKGTATRLLDGRVLFTGGEGFDRYCSIWDPVAGTVDATAMLNTGRQDHTATLLADGRVLVAGGNVPPAPAAPPSRSCEIYDPVARIWTTAGNLLVARARHSATLLPNGKVLIAGGQSDYRENGLEVYDPVARTSASHATTSSIRITATALPDGRTLLADVTNYDILLRYYNAATDALEWPTVAIVGAPWQAVAGVLADGRVILAGARTVLFTPATSASAVVDTPAVPRSYPLGVTLPDGRFLVAGGTDSRVVELFDPKALSPPRGDLDNDGRADIVWHHPATGQTRLWHMEGLRASVTLLPNWTPAPQTAWRFETLIDLDGGGVMDAIWRDTASANADIRWATGPDIQPRTDQGLWPIPLDWSIVAAADFDADGREDPLWRRTTGELEMWVMTEHYPLVRGTAFRASVPDPDFIVAAADDFDGDGRADVLWRHLVRGENYIWFMEGSIGMWSSYVVGRAGHTAPVTDMNYSVAGTGDFDGDGKADIVWRSIHGPTRIWFMNGVTIVNDVAVPAPGAGWTAAVIGDFDGDGKSDIFWRNPSTGQNAVSLFDGFHVKAERGLPPVTEAGWITPNP